jgi:hypothetical protein
MTKKSFHPLDGVWRGCDYVMRDGDVIIVGFTR